MQLLKEDFSAPSIGNHYYSGFIFNNAVALYEWVIYNDQKTKTNCLLLPKYIPLRFKDTYVENYCDYYYKKASELLIGN